MKPETFEKAQEINRAKNDLKALKEKAIQSISDLKFHWGHLNYEFIGGLIPRLEAIVEADYQQEKEKLEKQFEAL